MGRMKRTRDQFDRALAAAVWMLTAATVLTVWAWLL